MNFDLRFPIGFIFSFFGAMLLAYGFVSDASVYKKSLGINVNVGWGAVLLIFGAAMLLLAFWGRKNRSTV